MREGGGSRGKQRNRRERGEDGRRKGGGERE